MVFIVKQSQWKIKMIQFYLKLCGDVIKIRSKTCFKEDFKHTSPVEKQFKLFFRQ